VRECLRVASRRPDARQLRSHEALAPLLQARGVWRAQPVLRCTLSSSELSRLAAIPLSLNNEETWSLKDLFYFWKLAGGRVKVSEMAVVDIRVSVFAHLSYFVVVVVVVVVGVIVAVGGIGKESASTSCHSAVAAHCAAAKRRIVRVVE